MNVYIVVEGDKTELNVYPAWLGLLAPQLKRIDDAWEVSDNNYYIFSAGGIPSIYNHVSNAVADINDINKGNHKFDYLLVFLDTEEESRQYLEDCINEKLKKDNRVLEHTMMIIFEHKVCMETWFLGNKTVFKENPEAQEYLRFITYYNVGREDPEQMGNIDSEKFGSKAQFHHQYLRLMFRERNMCYLKSNPKDVCTENYLNKLIERYVSTGHIPTFGSWYEFVKKNLK